LSILSTHGARLSGKPPRDLQALHSVAGEVASRFRLGHADRDQRVDQRAALVAVDFGDGDAVLPEWDIFPILSTTYSFAIKTD
jgi:hypothetical protein